MTNNNPWCASTCTDIYFKVTDITAYGTAIVDVLEFSCSTGGVPGGATSGIEVLPVPNVPFKVGGVGWAQLVQSSLEGDCYWRAYALSRGGPLTIRFSICEPFSIGGGPCSVLVNILSRPNGVGVVPEEGEDGYGQTVYVRDGVGCFLNGTLEDLAGLGGYASYMNGVSNSNVSPASGANIMPPGVGFCPGSVTPRWEIIQMCCRKDGGDLE